ncbi:MAG: hypothetical protein MZU95_09240 [Desulfomicrobium escambiense]|nr:hypothetical protein [Desulfomicrobium escambiense]
MALFAALFFRERLSRRGDAQPGPLHPGQRPGPERRRRVSYGRGMVLAILSAVFAGLALNHLKRARATEDPFTLYLSPCLFGLPGLRRPLAARGFAFDPGAPGPGGRDRASWSSWPRSA